MKERIPCSKQRASLLMGDNSRVLRWPSRNGLHWRPVVDWRESATALPCLAPEEARLVARPQIRISWSTRRAYFECAGRKARKNRRTPDDLSLDTVYITVLPNTFWLEIQCTRGQTLLRNCTSRCRTRAGRIQPFGASFKIYCSSLSSKPTVPCCTGRCD